MKVRIYSRGDEKSVDVRFIDTIKLEKVCGCWKITTNHGLVDYYNTKDAAQAKFDELITAFRGTKKN